MADRETKLKAGKFPVDVVLVQKLVAAQFPQWADLPVRPVAMDGWDNWTFHLGDHMKVRLPSALGYSGQTEKENHWLPRLAPHLPFAIPTPLGVGAPTQDFPWHWAIYDWIDGDLVTRATDKLTLAADVANFLNCLQKVEPTGGPNPGPHNFERGAHPIDAYGAEARRCIAALSDRIDTKAAYAVLDAAAQSHQSLPVWVHGDLAAGNLLTRNGRLSAIIDFGCLAIGDPSCDLVFAWVLLDGASRTLFRAGVDVNPVTWERARAWALWKAALVIDNNRSGHPAEHTPIEVIAAVIADYREHG